MKFKFLFRFESKYIKNIFFITIPKFNKLLQKINSEEHTKIILNIIRNISSKVIEDFEYDIQNYVKEEISSKTRAIGSV